MRKTNLLKSAAKLLSTVALAAALLVSGSVSANAASTNLFTPTSGKYNYCPVGIQSGNTLYVAYCTNNKSNVIHDNIGIRTIKNGKASKEKIALSTTAGTWDAVDACDPSIIRGSFNYNGKTYAYLMAYLGCDTTDCQKNQIGFAVSNSLTSGWVKCNAINPVVSHSYDPSQSAFQWGVGQPSLISIDGAGSIALFYTSGTYNETCTYVETMNVSDLNNIQRTGKAKVTNNGTGDFISNGDFAIDGNYVYVCCDTHPFSAGILGNVSDSESIYRMQISNSGDVNCYANGTWELVTRIGAETTGHAKNHNGGFVRDVFGNLTANHQILVTVADQYSTFNESLWSYRVTLLNF